MNFRKKPVIIEAVRFNGSTQWDEAPEWLITATQKPTEEMGSISVDTWAKVHGEVVHAYIRTLEGVMQANPGDWIIKGVKGEIYPCREDIFRATYEREDRSAV